MLRYRPEDELRDALAPLIAMGCDGRQLNAFGLLLLVITLGMETPRVKQFLMELEASAKDITKIKDAAQALDRINSHRWIGPSGIRISWGLDNRNPLLPVLSPDQEKVSALVRIVDQSPDMMRSYMHLVEMRIEQMEAALRSRGKHPTRDALKFNLIEYVTECTGSPNYDLLSTFLEASRIANGGTEDVEEAEFTTQALQQFASRYGQRKQAVPRKRRTVTRRKQCRHRQEADKKCTADGLNPSDFIELFCIYEDHFTSIPGHRVEEDDATT
jgi:hypothetical protein